MTQATSLTQPTPQILMTFQETGLVYLRSTTQIRVNSWSLDMPIDPNGMFSAQETCSVWDSLTFIIQARLSGSVITGGSPMNLGLPPYPEPLRSQMYRASLV